MRAVFLAVVAVVTLATPAYAHPQGQKPVAIVNVRGSTADVAWVVAPDDLATLVDHLHVALTTPERLPEDPVFVGYVRERLAVSDAAGVCAPGVPSVALAGRDFVLRVAFDCASAPGEMRLTLLQDISTDYFTLAEVRIDGRRVRRGVFGGGQDSLSLSRATGPARTTATTGQKAGAEGRTGRVIAALRNDPSGGTLAGALALAFALGALHALTPGHGKTLTAAYLVGEGGSRREAIGLGGVVAVTHAISVAALGAIAVRLNALLLPSTWGPWTEVIAGVLVAGMGVALLRRWFGHHHHHWGDGHDHEHAEKRSRPPVRRLALLGLVGGLVPSPEAVGIVLVAFSLGRWLAGVALVVAFSLGLAAVVLAVAVAALKGGALLRRATSHRMAHLAPRAAGAIVVVLGLALAARGASRL